MSIEEFIKSQLQSVDDLRALLLFHSNLEPTRDAEETASRLYIPPAAAATVLARLAERGFLTGAGEPPRYRFQPRDLELAALIQELAELDRKKPVTLLKMIYSRPKDIQAFADAFKLKKET